IAQDSRTRDMGQVVQRFQDIAPCPRRDIEQPHRTASRMGLFDEGAQYLCEMHLALADATPANTVEVGPVEQTSEGRNPLRPVLVHIVERYPRVKACLPAQADTATQTTKRLHGPPCDGKRQTAWRHEAIILCFGVATLIRIEP